MEPISFPETLAEIVWLAALDIQEAHNNPRKQVWMHTWAEKFTTSCVGCLAGHYLMNCGLEPDDITDRIDSLLNDRIASPPALIAMSLNAIRVGEWVEALDYWGQHIGRPSNCEEFQAVYEDLSRIKPKHYYASRDPQPFFIFLYEVVRVLETHGV